MSTVSKTFSVWKDAIPAACFAADERVRARVTGISGVDTLDMTITAIEEGSGDYDQVTFSYESEDVGGETVGACNLSAFYCLECECSTVYDMSVQGESRGLLPREENTHEDGLTGADPEEGQLWNLGRLPRDFQADSIIFDLPDFFGDPQTLHVALYAATLNDFRKVADANLIASPPRFYKPVHRASFETAFSNGRIPGESEMLLLVQETNPPETRQVPHAAIIHLVGRWLP